MEDNKINTYLSGKGIDLSLPFLDLNEEVLGDISQRYVFTETSFSMCRIKNQIRGQKKELDMRNCIVENINIRGLSVSGKCMFYNCTFDNVKFVTCTLLNCCFYHCTFINVSFVESTLKSSILINCTGLEKVDFSKNNLDNMKVIGSEIDVSVLQQNDNRTEGIYVRREMFMNEENKVKEDQEAEKKEEGKFTLRRTIEKQTYKNKVFASEELKNTLFSECTFISCEFDRNSQLEADTDFFKCSFSHMKMEVYMMQKVIFDYSTFEDVFMSSKFVHCSFVGCEFDEMNFGDNVMFSSCNFSMSNASQVFDAEKQHIENYEFSAKSSEDVELNEVLNALYSFLKGRDKKLQYKLKMLDRDGVSRDIVIDYMKNLDDRTYIEFITDIGSKRKVGNDE